VNPMSTSRSWDRHATSRGRSDPGDAKVLADMDRIDRTDHLPVSRPARGGGDPAGRKRDSVRRAQLSLSNGLRRGPLTARNSAFRSLRVGPCSGTARACILVTVARRGRFLMVPWAGGGSVSPELGLADALLRRGHTVQVLGSPVLRDRFEALGCTFRVFRRARESHLWHEHVFEEHLPAWFRFISGAELATDVLAELDDYPADAAIVDSLLFAALTAAEKAGLPSAAIVHNLYQLGTQIPAGNLVDGPRPLVNSTRAHLGLDLLDAGEPLGVQLRDRATLALACQPEELDYPLTAAHPNLRYVGPILETASTEWSPPSCGRLVLVSLSTTNMRQGPTLEAILDAAEGLDLHVLCTLGGVSMGSLRCPDNVTVEQWRPHNAVLPRTSLVVTHGGLSTVLGALAYGVPLVCLPMGRDQPANAERVAAVRAGLYLSADPLRSPSDRRSRRSLTGKISGWGPAEWPRPSPGTATVP
jgi:MGT family glycosyltransferase